MASSFIFHLHPRTIPADTARFTLSFGLGGICATLAGLLFLTGILQLISYSPRTGEAYHSILQMYAQGGLGGFIRNIHYWAGNLLVITTGLHLLRVFLTGGLTQTRRYNWLIGLLLLALVLFSNFTGYLLPWDQLAYWAVTIFTSMLSYIPFFGEKLTPLLRGGVEVGPETLANFFAIHVGLIPALFIPLLIYHFWLIRKAGGLITDPNGTTKKNRLKTVPHLIEREAAVGLTTLAMVLIFSALVDAPLGEQANPSQSPNPAKAAWYFMGLQELLLHLHPVFAICVIPLLMFGGMMTLPFLKNSILPAGVWFGGSRGKLTACMAFISGFLITVSLLMFDELISAKATQTDSAILMRGFAPLMFYTLLVAFFYGLTRKRGSSRAEGTMGVVLFVVSSTITLTVAGIWFRGPGMTMVLPF
ncbi:cytochrome b N-terminal domain-containing protein [Desulfopila sp. IMCC35008]|uniref:cytochrome b N-terminal domain-containing protein n=1 Tax=Desulfopila sp. IMCC35008 TaxID=2653858 RepID=UPI0013D10EF3|nr:cytochrome b N-terminal domain-containing protein [Desulfopila sp. IMCC35008]